MLSAARYTKKHQEAESVIYITVLGKNNCQMDVFSKLFHIYQLSRLKITSKGEVLIPTSPMTHVQHNLYFPPILVEELGRSAVTDGEWACRHKMP